MISVIRRETRARCARIERMMQVDQAVTSFIDITTVPAASSRYTRECVRAQLVSHVPRALVFYFNQSILGYCENYVILTLHAVDNNIRDESQNFLS